MCKANLIISAYKGNLYSYIRIEVVSLWLNTLFVYIHLHSKIADHRTAAFNVFLNLKELS